MFYFYFMNTLETTWFKSKLHANIVTKDVSRYALKYILKHHIRYSEYVNI